MNNYWFDKLKEAGREVIRTEKALRANKWSWMSCPPPPLDSPGGRSSQGFVTNVTKPTLSSGCLLTTNTIQRNPMRRVGNGDTVR